MSRHARALDVLVGATKAGRPGTTIGTDRAGIDPGSDHTPWLKDSAGVGVVRAADIMTRDGGRLATNLAAKLNKHPAMGSGAYVIWYQRIISADRAGEGWRQMEDRGGDTQNHKDHVHVSLTRNQAGYDYTGSWGALWSGSGTGAAPTPVNPATPPGGLDTSPLGGGDTRPVVGGMYGNAGANVGLDFVPDLDIAETVTKFVYVGGALMLGAVLIALGAARATKPARAAAQKSTQDAAGTLAVVMPQGRAATAAAATTATKGTP